MSLDAPLQPGDVTHLLRAWREGDTEAGCRLFELVYPVLRAISRRQLALQGDHVSLQVTEVVNELYLRLLGSRTPDWRDRAQFFAFAAQLVRALLVDHYRTGKAQRRGGNWRRIDLDSAPGLGPVDDAVDLLALDAALKGLEEMDAEAAKVVELRYFGGLSVEEVAEALGLGRSTVVRRWRHARAWLRQALDAQACGG